MRTMGQRAHVWSSARSAKAVNRPPRCHNCWMRRAWFLPPLSFVAAAIVIVRWRYTLITVRGTSMLPNLRPGQRVLVDRRRRSLDLGDIVLVHSPAGFEAWRVGARTDRADADCDFFIKRITATGGDLMPAYLGGDGTLRVPDGHVILLGDGPGSLDSRSLGACPVAAVVGVARRVLD